MADVDYDRVRKVCALLASESDGEVLAAARRLVAIAKAHKLTVGELLFHPRASSPQPAPDPRTWPKNEPHHNWGKPADGACTEEMFERYADFIRRQSNAQAHARPRDDYAGINWAPLFREIREYATRGLATYEQIAVAEFARNQLDYHVSQGGDPLKWRPPSMDAAQIVALARKLGIVIPIKSGA